MEGVCGGDEGGGDENIPSVEKGEPAKNEGGDEKSSFADAKFCDEDIGLAAPSAEKDIERDCDCEQHER